MNDENAARVANAQATEEYIILLLSDANLPTGSFVASSSLESYIKHGFFSSSSTISTEPTFIASPSDSEPSTEPQPPHLVKSTINFIRDSLHTYSHSALPFIRCIHEALDSWKESGVDETENVLKSIAGLDGLYDTMVLNHVSRRASKAQGVALLTLLSKGFTRPAWIPITASPSSGHGPQGDKIVESLIDEFKLTIRKGVSPGHLPVCWGMLTYALGLGTVKSQRLHLFLHVRGLLSASIRLNTIGPYAAQQLLLHVVRPLLDEAMEKCGHLRIRMTEEARGESDILQELGITDDHEHGPANTWPLGEILAGRHDLQHSRIFNS